MAVHLRGVVERLSVMFLTLPLQHALMRLLTGLLSTHHHTEQQAKQTGEYDDSNHE